jgi:phosphate-selective porin OprO/OprP
MKMLLFKNCRYKSCGVLVAAAAFLIFASMPGFGQTGSPSPSPSASPASLAATPSPSPTPSPARRRDDAPPSITGDSDEPETNTAQPAPVNYFFPDLTPGLTTYNNKYFSVRVAFAVFTDYTFIGQDSISRAQVGPQASKFDLRAARIGLTGQIKFKRPWTYVIARDFNENRVDGDRLFDGLDFYLTIPLWKKARITLGKQKEPFIYEMVGDSANLPQQERVLNPFFTSRNVGIRYQDNYLNDKMSFSVGVYNDWFQSDRSFHNSGTQVSGRLTGLPIESKDGRSYLHLGVGFRHIGADDGKLRYKGRPESNVTDNYVDTGNFPAKYARQLALEALYNKGPFSVLSEYVHAWVNSSATGNPEFSGFYVTGSYVLTGENRPYDKRVGYARQIIPKSRWGAVELVGRFGYLDLDDTLIKGGKLATWYAGANWWASRQWKLGVGYGLADLDRFGTTGRTQRWMTRVQWVY